MVKVKGDVYKISDEEEEKKKSDGRRVTGRKNNWKRLIKVDVIKVM